MRSAPLDNKLGSLRRLHPPASQVCSQSAVGIGAEYNIQTIHKGPHIRKCKAIALSSWNVVGLIFVNIPVFFSRVSVFRLENPIYKKIAFLSLLASALIAQAISAAANGVTYKVRLENGSGEKKKWGGAAEEQKMGRFRRETFELA
jgi:hypothetical protein